MALNNFHIQIATAYPELHEIESGRGKIYFGDIETDQGRKSAHIKLLNTENIAKEALCNVLARTLHLPIQPAYYVNMNNTEYSGGRSGNMDGLAFGMLYDNTPSFHIRTLKEKNLLLWQDLLPCAVFDEWIANGDRMPDNLVFDKNGVFWLFDHDDALKGHVRPSAPISPALLTLKSKGKPEIDLFRIRNEAKKIVNNYHKINWQEIRNCLEMDQVTGSAFHYNKFISFLSDRLLCMNEILSHDLGIKQQELFEANNNDNSKDSNK